MDKKIIDDIKSFLIEGNVEEVIKLHLEGNSIPFMARYRKDKIGYIDEVKVKEIIDLYMDREKFYKRKSFILNVLEEKGLMSDENTSSLDNCQSIKELEVFYSPFKERKSRKIEKAIEIGVYDTVSDRLESFKSGVELFDVNGLVENLIEEDGIEEDVSNLEDLISEVVKEKVVSSLEVRNKLEDIYEDECLIEVEVLSNTTDYNLFEGFRDKLSSLKSNQLLSLEKGVKEGNLKVKYVSISEDIILNNINEVFLGFDDKEDLFLNKCFKEGFNSRLKRSLENSLYKEMKEKSDKEAVKYFESNLESLLMVSPIRGVKVLAIDPAYRSGCKVAVLDETGKLLSNSVIYPHNSFDGWESGKFHLINLIKAYDVDMIGIGNGTASRETEKLVIEVLDYLSNDGLSLEYRIVNESGASVYSGSDEARAEFGYLDITDRSAISIGRRLLDPLSEFVKINPRSIGVGEYQHIVNKKYLDDSLEFVVERVVNRVGVDLNTASVSLLKYVSGLSERLSNNIVSYRDEFGLFKSVSELLDVPGVGRRTFEQCGGFLRVYGGVDRLDETGVHPESYESVRYLMGKYSISENDIGSGRIINLDECDILYKDVIEELLFSNDIRIKEDSGLRISNVSLKDLNIGDLIVGEVRSVVSFGAFVDIGLDRDSFVHISEFADGFVSNPLDILNVGDCRKFKIIAIDIESGKTNLSLKYPVI